jgi:hypothetical protein
MAKKDFIGTKAGTKFVVPGKFDEKKFGELLGANH